MKTLSLRAALACLFMALSGSITAAGAAEFATTNFRVYAATPALAKEIGLAAEAFRRDLAVEWLGQELPNWSEPCPVIAKVNPRLGAQGATTFFAGNGRAWGWKMEVIGSRERVLDSVLPHEITHTVFATHFGRRLPRWADEGACTTVEDVTERRKHDKLLVHFLKNDRALALHQLFAIREYPDDILPLYSQGYSLCRFLIEQNGKRDFVRFMAHGMERGDWLGAVRQHYGYASFVELQTTWMAWIREGSPVLAGQPYRLDDSTTLVAAQQSRGDTSPNEGDTRRPRPSTRTALNGPISGPINGSVGRSTSGSREIVASRNAGPADAHGWYARRFLERSDQPRHYATSHSSAAAQAASSQTAATKPSATQASHSTSKADAATILR